MNERMKNIFSQSDCLSEEQLSNYHLGKLDEVERHAIEHHLLDCELCNDAIEGFKLLKEPNDLKNINKELHQRIHTLIENPEETPVKILFPWRIAAAFALIFISGLTLWLILPKQDNTKLFTQEYKPYPAPDPKEVPITSTNASETLVIEKEKTISEQRKINLKTPSQIETKAGNEQSDESADQATQMAIATYETKDVVATREMEEKQIQVSKTENKISELDRKLVSKTPAIEKTNEEKTEAVEILSGVTTDLSKAKINQLNTPSTTSFEANKYQQGVDAYQKGDYASAIKLFDETSTIPEALFYSGVSYLSLNNTRLAIERLQLYRKKSENKLTEASYWYEALAQLKENDKKAVRKCLKEVIKFNGTYREQAEQLMKKL